MEKNTVECLDRVETWPSADGMLHSTGRKWKLKEVEHKVTHIIRG